MLFVQNDLYYFDEAAAARAEKFIEKYLCHYEDRWAGKPFLLLEWQRKLVRDVFGWKRLDNRLRRFREVYIEIAKGNGKSPLLAAIGAYMLLADNEQGALVLSAATVTEQAAVTFDTGKQMLAQSPRLQTKVEIKQHEIEAPKNSVWRIVSGDAAGKAGARPTCVLMDEAWEWPNRKLYDSLTRNAKKRSQSLVVIATNSGKSQTSICWELHERARKVIQGISNDDTLYAVIFAADEKDDPGSPQTWKKANPALDEIITSETLESEWVKAQDVPALEAEFLRLHLSRWVNGTSKWLDMAQWDACEKPFDWRALKQLPLVLSLDMSLVDDLTALSFTWIGASRLHTRCRFWLPRKTAAEYEERESVPFALWAKQKHIQLIDEDTINARVHRRLAKTIIAVKEAGFKIVCLAYDRSRASRVVKKCEKAGIICIPVPQNWELSPAAEELTRLLKQREIDIYPNPVLRWNAANCEASTDRKGNIHIIKEGRQGSYKGRRGCKIDGVAATITGLSQVLREQMQEKKPSVYEGRGVFVV